MDIIEDCLVQAAVYWPPLGQGRSTRQLYGPPEQLACRWADRQEVVKGSSVGTPFDSSAQVMVDRDVQRLGRLYLAGNLDEDDDAAARLALALAATDPNSLGGEAQVIQQVRKTPTLDGSQSVRTAFL